jgi:hypothetical protein
MTIEFGTDNHIPSKWRESTMYIMINVLLAPTNKADVEAWQKTNDAGALQYFSP